LEKKGIPTVTIATDQFISLARNTMASQGLKDMSFVIIPHPIGVISHADVHSKVAAAFDDILEAATQWKPSGDVIAQSEAPYPAKRFTFTGTYADLNSMFLSRKWSLGLPIVPPTADKVKEMLKATRRSPSEVLWVVPPRDGQLTVELVAVLGVMAGAKPEHMPLLIAAVEAMREPDAAWRSTTTTTANTQPMFIISGPVVEKLSINVGTGNAGPLNPVGNSLGYFANLVGDIVGGSVAPEQDKTVQGVAADFVGAVFAENIPATPWNKTLAEQLGFKRTDSIITLSTSLAMNICNDHGSSGMDLIYTMSMAVAGSGTGRNAPCNIEFGNNYGYVMLIVGPEHANSMMEAVNSLDELKDALAANSGLARKYYGAGRCQPGVHYDGSDNPDFFVPRFRNGNSFFLAVSGGPGKHSQIWSPFAMFRPVAVKIEGF
jgi:hypothetical protein